MSKNYPLYEHIRAYRLAIVYAFAMTMRSTSSFYAFAIIIGLTSLFYAFAIIRMKFSLFYALARKALMEIIRTISDLGKFIRETRKSQGITQTQLAQLSGCGLSFITNLENGKATSEIGKALNVMNSLGIDFAAIRRGE